MAFLALFITLKVGLSLYWLMEIDWYPSLILVVDFLAGAGLLWIRRLWFLRPTPQQMHLKAMILLGLFTLIVTHNYHLHHLGYLTNDLFFVVVMIAAFDFGAWGGLISGMLSLSALLAFSLADGTGPTIQGPQVGLVVQHLVLYIGISVVTGRLVDELVVQREHYRVIVNESDNPIVRVDLKGRVTLFNRAAEHLTGWTKHEVLGRPEWVTVHGGRKYRDEGDHTSMATRALDLRKEERNIPYASTADGQERHFLVDTHLIHSPAGRLTGAFAIYKEITAQKRQEQELAVVNDQLQQLSVTDDLTGLQNRRRCDERLQEEWVRIGRTSDPLAIILLDVDHFKEINDTYGHHAGDLVLKKVATCLQRTVRDIDMPFRYGGEEFLIVLPETDLSGALLAAERVREEIASLAVDWEGAPLSVTVSLGVAAVEGPAQDGHAGLVAAADKALYEAKNSGRNRVCTSGELPTTLG